jgi:LuxR family maltose regulon positive regulatory protein
VADILLQTKLYIPTPTVPLVARRRLFERLQALTRTRLTLVAAPAGFGKTTLVATYLTECSNNPKSKIQNLKFAWLSLDPGDNEATRFFLYWIAALQTVAPHCGRQTQLLLLSPQPTPPETILTLLLNEMAALTEPLALVLDDYHLITNPAIHEALTLIIDRLPAMVHLLLISRADPPLPLPRWRVRSQLAEIRAADLRFTVEEAATFLNQVMGLQLMPADIATLEARTEGWIAALQLAALSMQGQHDVQGFLRSFTGGQRYVVDYLVDEVLSRQPPAIQRFLLETAILDRFCAPLCAAVLRETSQERDEREAQALLEQLERSNLFLIPLDGERQWYRYHALFSEFLRHRLGSGTVLHRRAAAWYEAHGLVVEAIQHWLAAADVNPAVTLMEAHSLAFSLNHQLATIQGWLDALPGELRWQRPGLALAEVWLALGRGDVLAMSRRLQALDDLITRQATALAATVAAEVAAAHALVASFQQQHTTTIDYAKEALATLPTTAQPLRQAVLSGLGYGYYCAGDLAAAEQTLCAALASGGTTSRNDVTTITLHSMLAMTIEMQGRLQEAIDLLRQALTLAQVDGRYLPAAGVEVALHGLGLRLYEFNQLDEAEHYVQIARELSMTTGNSMIYGHSLATLGLIVQARGDLTRAQSLMDEAVATLRPLQTPSYDIADGQRVFLWCKRAELTAAATWAATICDTLPSRPPFITTFITPYFSLARVWLLQERFAEADSLLADLYQAATASRYAYYALWSLILQTLSYAAQHKADWRATLEQALRQAAPVGYLRSFLDEGEPMRALLTEYLTKYTPQDAQIIQYGQRLLNAFGTTGASVAPALSPNPTFPSAANAALIEPLSERELEVLRLVERGLANQAIADELIIALSTVKKHLINIYGKLAVNSRTQALTRARVLGLL